MRLELSPVLLVDGRPAAFSLAAVREEDDRKRAWIAGFGVAPKHRRRGLAGQVMRRQNEMLDSAGVGETWLEVIDVNPARRVYAAAGFDEVRTLRSFQGAPDTSAAAGRWERVEPSRLAEVHAAVYARSPTAPTWRREAAALSRSAAEGSALEVIGVLDGHGTLAAYAAAVASPDRLGLLDAAADSVAAADRLFAALAESFADRPIRLIDEPEASPIAAALLAGGLTPFLSQIEMVRKA